ncbi:hypothetical protein CDL12_06394 [Handroanthus impetiginosus]|uniref:Uncharacterized protein n=1 Tax=Handroanthus impetiginosus TaxID=429701 RepID=A0A2G9HUB5_9LAMI|nr:hypothetical protein CDL12_06394 [Handroanthus impetiginosus]
MALPQQQSAAPKAKVSGVVVRNSGGWATFDMPQNAVPIGTENSAPAMVPSSDENIKGNFNPFSIDQSSSYQDSAGHETSGLTHNFGHADPQKAGATINNAHLLWTAFEDSAGGQPIQNMLKSNEQAALHSTSDADNSLGFRAFNNDGIVISPNESEPPSSGLLSNSSTALYDFPVVSAVAGMQSFVTDHKRVNPFDLPYDSELESSEVSQFWDMSSLQAALPNAQTSPFYVGGGNQSWIPQNSFPSYVPGGVPFDPNSGSLGFISGQATSAQIPNIQAQGPVASVGGNPFA